MTLLILFLVFSKPKASTACRPTAATSTRGTFSSLENDLRRYQIASLALGTIKTYTSGEKQFINFYHQFHLHKHVPLLPSTGNILIYFAVFLAKTVNPEITSPQSAICIWSMAMTFLRLHYILRGIKRIKGASTRTRLPITLDHLKLFHRILHSRASPTHDVIMIWAAITTAFFSFLRIGEITCSGLFNSSTHLSRSDVSFHDKTNDHEAFLNLRIKASKTDPFRSSTTITIGSTSGIICPVRALKRYLSRTSTDHAAPLFCYSNGTPLSRSQFTKELRALLAQGGRSFRIGAATTAASKGLPHWLIQTLGRWSSDCYLRYIRTPAYVLADVSKRLIAM